MTVVVARLLAPSDYGLVGMAGIFVNLFTLFSEFGIGTAVVTMQDLTEHQASQLNTLSLFLGLVGFVFSAAMAIPLGKFFHAPSLPLVVIVLSGGFIVSGVRTVPYSLLQKELRFRLLAVIEGIQGLVSGIGHPGARLSGFWLLGPGLGILSLASLPRVSFCSGVDSALLCRDSHPFEMLSITVAVFLSGDCPGRLTMIRTSSLRVGFSAQHHWAHTPSRGVWPYPAPETHYTC